MTITELQGRSTIPLAACSYLLILHPLMDFNYHAQIEDIAPRPILLIIGTEAATIFMSKAGFEKAAQPKEWFEIPGATHHRLYDDEAAVGKAVAKLEEFFGRSL